MTEFLHAGALGAMVLCGGCVALALPRPGVRELLVMLLMTLGMLDMVAHTRVLPAVVWSAATLVASVALVMRRRDGSDPAAVTRLRVHSALSGVLMSGLMLGMASGHAQSTGAHDHGSSAMVLVGGSALFVASAVYSMRSAPAMVRLHYASLAVSVGLAAAAVAV